MFEKTAKKIFLALFAATLVIPLATTNVKQGEISEDENRYLTPFPALHNEDGSLNTEFTSDFENWINDNIGQRSSFVEADALLRYHLFHRFPENSNYYPGPNGELNYATHAMLEDYQHLNLFPPEYLQELANAMQTISDYTASRGAKFYFYQCWDKHSVYPEQFPRTVIQTGSKSRTDTVIQTLQEQTDVSVISPKQDLIDAKTTCDTYSVWGDPTHWSPRGAYIGYRKLMDAINAETGASAGTGNGGRTDYRVLKEDDYTITWPDQGKILFNVLHENDYIEAFTIKDPHAELTNEKLTLYADDQRNYFYTNGFAGNRTRLLLIGDSYFANFLLDDLAESFYELVFIHAHYVEDIEALLDAYPADIVVLETAERVNRSKGILTAGYSLMESAES